MMQAFALAVRDLKAGKEPQRNQDKIERLLFAQWRLTIGGIGGYFERGHHQKDFLRTLHRLAEYYAILEEHFPQRSRDAKRVKEHLLYLYNTMKNDGENRGKNSGLDTIQAVKAQLAYAALCQGDVERLRRIYTERKFFSFLRAA